MKRYIQEFLKRGLLAASGGPLILAAVYGSLGAAGTVTALAPAEVCRGILTVTLMAFVAGGISMVYSIERLPLLPATAIHAVALYADYLLIYLVNDWIAGGWKGIGIFTLIYVTGYLLIWLGILFSIKMHTERLNRKLKM